MHMLEQNKGQDHVSAQDQAFENMSLHGPDVYLCSEYGNQLELTMTSANQLSIDTGALLVNGRYCIIDPAETLSVDNGSSGMTEYDLVCVHWKVTSGTGTNQQEEAELAIVKGTPASSGATDPTITNKVIKPGITEAYVPFARITKNGLTPSVELIVPTMVPEAEFRDSISLIKTGTTNCIKGEDTVVTFDESFPSGLYYNAVAMIFPSTSNQVYMQNRSVQVVDVTSQNITLRYLSSDSNATQCTVRWIAVATRAEG